MQKTWKVFFVCALGALIGSFIGLQATHSWWGAVIAGIAGFCIGYPAWDFKQIKCSAPIAWNRATAWRPNTQWWEVFAKQTIVLMGVATTASIGAVLFIILLAVLPPHSHHLQKIPFLLGANVAAGFGAFIGLLLSFGVTDSTEEMERKLNRNMESLQYVCNPFKVYLWTIPKYMYIGYFWLMWQVPKGIKLFCKAVSIGFTFAWHLFKLIHSEERLLCGVDAAIGAMIGFYWNNAIVGAIVGGLWGVLNFEILSIRVLRLVPAEQSVFRSR